MSKPIRNQTGYYAIHENNKPESIKPNDPKSTFRKMFIYQASNAATNGILTDNAADIFIGKDSDGPKVCPDLLNAANPIPMVITIPDGLPPMLVCDILVYGTIGDGVFFSYV